MASQPEGSPRRRVVIVERDPGVRTLLVRLLSHWGMEALAVESSDEGARAARDHGPVALVISDFRPADGERTMYEHLRSVSPRPRFLCTFPTAAGVPDGVAVVERPFEVDALHDAVNRLLTA